MCPYPCLVYLKPVLPLPPSSASLFIEKSAAKTASLPISASAAKTASLPSPESAAKTASLPISASAAKTASLPISASAAKTASLPNPPISFASSRGYFQWSCVELGSGDDFWIWRDSVFVNDF